MEEYRSQPEMLVTAAGTLIIVVLTCVSAFEQPFAHGQNSLDLMEEGKTQYQLLREKSNLPRYGPCWKGALEHVEGDCRHLSEDTQSDMALHITNCFLEMSGHETYNCDFDKKPNLRSYCIGGMSDRAFNVYTEFYTHVQNICWFLRGQMWYETMSENSFKVAWQLEESARTQELLLDSQKASLDMQERILRHERMLADTLSDLYVSAQTHQEILKMLAKRVGTLQSWLVGEVSWFDSVLFYFLSGVSILICTSMRQTANARLSLLTLLFANFVFERCLSSLLVVSDHNAATSYQNVYVYMWYCRYISIALMFSCLFYHSYKYKNFSIENHKLLVSIMRQNSQILELMTSHNNNSQSFKLTDLGSSQANHIPEAKSSRYNLRKGKSKTPEKN